MMRAFDKWLLPYLLRDRGRRRGSGTQPLNVAIAVCDHFEPFHDTDKKGALRAMGDWEQTWPAMVGQHEDSAGRGPRHTFFFPIEQYDRDVIDRLADLCRRTGSEVEVHLHHHDDTEESLREKLTRGIGELAGHGLLPRESDGRIRYGFIHGNWALDNSHPEGRHCGVSNELSVLKATGCYADFTLPSAPDPAQTRIINSIYHAREDGNPKSHDRGRVAKVGETLSLHDEEDHLFLVQGPLGLNWRWRKWGLVPRLENADLTGANPPTLNRFHLWCELAPGVLGGAPWIFIKLHTHGGIARNYRTLLGEPAHRFHRDLKEWSENRPGVRYHYVTAREMVNLIHDVEGGGSPEQVAPGGMLPPPPIFTGG